MNKRADGKFDTTLTTHDTSIEQTSREQTSREQSDAPVVSATDSSKKVMEKLSINFIIFSKPLEKISIPDEKLCLFEKILV